MLSTPHAGYHWDHSRRRFFEGWYYRLTLPQIQQSFAFMYSIEDPMGGQPHSGGSVQVLGPDDRHQWRTFPQVRGFWADPDRLALAHWGRSRTPSDSQPHLLSPQSFEEQITSGYQVTDTLNQGIFTNPATGSLTRWCYQIDPVYGYGLPKSIPLMGIFSYWPVFEPGWQILMAHGLASGWVEWQGQRYDFDRVPAYAEKNWGGSFPLQWFWLQCNYFPSQPDLTVTSAGARRGVLWWQEEVAMIGLHWQGQFLQWLPENSRISWSISPWGSWRVEAEKPDYQIRLEGCTQRPGSPLLTPTTQGLRYSCRETLLGRIRLQLWRIRSQIRILEMDALSHWSGLEVGGDLWLQSWENTPATSRANAHEDLASNRFSTG